MTIETKEEVVGIGYNGFLFPEFSGERLDTQFTCNVDHVIY